MDIGMIGLGKMGANMTTRLVNGGHHVVVTDRKPEAVEAAAAYGAVPAKSLDDLVANLDAPRVVWVMAPSGSSIVAVLNIFTPYANGLSIAGLGVVKNFAPCSVIYMQSSKRTPNSP